MHNNKHCNNKYCYFFISLKFIRAIYKLVMRKHYSKSISLIEIKVQREYNNISFTYPVGSNVISRNDRVFGYAESSLTVLGRLPSLRKESSHVIISSFFDFDFSQWTGKRMDGWMAMILISKQYNTDGVRWKDGWMAMAKSVNKATQTVRHSSTAIKHTSNKSHNFTRQINKRDLIGAFRKIFFESGVEFCFNPTALQVSPLP